MVEVLKEKKKSYVSLIKNVQTKKWRWITAGHTYTHTYTLWNRNPSSGMQDQAWLLICHGNFEQGKSNKNCSLVRRPESGPGSRLKGVHVWFSSSVGSIVFTCTILKHLQVHNDHLWKSQLWLTSCATSSLYHAIEEIGLRFLFFTSRREKNDFHSELNLLQSSTPT